jgi:hypothetical protein
MSSIDKYFIVTDEILKLLQGWGISYDEDWRTLDSIFKCLSLPLSELNDLKNKHQKDKDNSILNFVKRIPNEAYAARLADKSKRFLLLPRPIKNEDMDEQIFKFVKYIRPEVLGCFSTIKEHRGINRSKEWFLAAMSECIIKHLQSSLKSNRQLSIDYSKKVNNLVRFSQTRMESHSVLSAIPAVDLTETNLYKINSALDEILCDEFDTTHYSNFITNKVYTGFNPERILVTRSHHMTLAQNANLLNRFTKWNKEHKELTTNINSLRDEEITETLLELYNDKPVWVEDTSKFGNTVFTDLMIWNPQQRLQAEPENYESSREKRFRKITTKSKVEDDALRNSLNGFFNAMYSDELYEWPPS